MSRSAPWGCCVGVPFCAFCVASSECHGTGYQNEVQSAGDSATPLRYAQNDVDGCPILVLAQNDVDGCPIPVLAQNDVDGCPIPVLAQNDVDGCPILVV